MGSGASKNNGPKGNLVKEIDSEIDDFSPPPSLHRKKQPTLHSANQLPKLPQKFDTAIKDVPRTIVGLEDSDDEDYTGKKPGNSRNISDDKKLEQKLKREIVDLENTLSDLEASKYCFWPPDSAVTHDILRKYTSGSICWIFT